MTTTRRQFLAGAAVAAGAATTSGRALAEGNPENLPPNVAEWSQYLGASVDEAPYGMPSEYEADVVRRSVEWLTASRESSINFTPLYALDGTITPSGVAFERHHGGAPNMNPADYRLMINGLVDKPLLFTLEDLKRFPRVTKTYFLECAANSGMEWRGAQLNGCQYTHGMIHNVEYSGVLLKDILEEAGLKTDAKWILPEGADAAGMTRSIPMEKALDDCLVAFTMNGEALRVEQGYPVRLVVPGWEGNMWVKWMRRIEVGDKPWHHREETSKYTDLLANGKARRFTWVMDAKSVITSPSPQASAMKKGPNVLTGLAWSGNGAIDRVDVSLDGGQNWFHARVQEPRLPKACARFYFDFVWDGKPLLLQSRAIDSTGYVQPTKDELREVRGENSIYHNNGIQTWHVRENGEVENVEVS